jgi:Cof subfamily protein (haloacid dehalogenase superfamily)
MPFSNIRMIVMDMDDTLLNPQHEISPANKQAILDAQKAGITIVLASGRPTPAMASSANQLQLQSNGGFVISYNGAFVTDWSNQNVLYETCLTKYENDLLVDAAHTQGLNLHTYVEGDIVTDEMNDYTDIEAELTSMPIKLVDDLKQTVKGKVPKVLMVAEPSKLQLAAQTLKASLGGRFTISISKPFFLEFTNQEVDKSRGISVLCEKLNIAKEDVMAIGDSYNDLTMIQDCGTGVAMGNAPQDIKDIANEITSSNAEDGVAQIINKVIANQQLSTNA